MAILPVRDLGSAGVITDTAPYNIPINAFSTGVNVRFDEGKVRARLSSEKLKTASASPHVTLSASFRQRATTLWSWSPMTMRSTSTPAGWCRTGVSSITGSSDPRPFTTTQLADVTYINRPDRVPVFRGPAGTNFADLTNWPSNFRAASLRAFGDF